MTRTNVLAAALVLVAAGAAQAGVVFYGGDHDDANGLSDEFNTDITDSYVFDDFNWAGGTVDALFGNYFTNLTTIAGMQFEIRSGVSSGNGGVLVASGNALGFTWVDTGADAFGFDLYTGTADVADFALAAGTYHLGLRAIGFGSGRFFLATTSGANSVGAPIGNGNAFFQSGYFGENFNPTNQGGGLRDFSQGVISTDVRVVPLPPASLLGLGLLGGLGVISRLRRRRIATLD